MKPYWITFNPRSGPTFFNLGVGITAHDEADARALLAVAFPDESCEVAGVATVDQVANLDQGHVVPNMGNIFARGIWFPIGFE